MAQIYLAYLFLVWAAASAIPSTDLETTESGSLRTLSRRQDDRQCAGRVAAGQCGFTGNADFYGLGIRTGFYLQYAALTVALTFVPSERTAQTSSFAMFTVASFLALFVIALRDQCTFEIEAIVMLYLLTPALCTLGVCATAQMIFTVNAYLELGSLSGLYYVYTLIFTASTAFALWFWLVTAGAVKSSMQPSNCGNTFFLFAPISGGAVQGTSIFMAIISALLLASCVWGLVFFIGPLRAGLMKATYRREAWAALWRRKDPQASNRDRSMWSSSILPTMPEGADDRWKRGIIRYAVGGLICNIVLLVWTMLGVELPLYWNRVEGVYSLASTGQFIPLIVGIGAWIQLLNAFYRQVSLRISLIRATLH